MLTGYLGEAHWAFEDLRLQCNRKARLGDEDFSVVSVSLNIEARGRSYQSNFQDLWMAYLMPVLALCNPPAPVLSRKKHHTSGL